MSTKTFRHQLKQLRELRLHFGIEPALRKTELLHSISLHPLRGKKDLLEYHELLLFILAYPDSEQVRSSTMAQLKRLSDIFGEMVEKDSTSFQNSFSESGVAFSMVNSNPTLEACKWMLEYYGEDVQIHPDKEFISSVGGILPLLCIGAQEDGLTDNRFDALDWIANAAGVSINKHYKLLVWLVKSFDALPLDNKTKDFLFERAGINVNLNLNVPANSRTLHHISIPQPFFQQEPLVKYFDADNKINEKGCLIRELKGSEADALMTSAKIVLASRGRETDPVTYADKIIEVTAERGLVIYLFSMTYDRKLPIENYTGFVAYKNGVPLGYGGGWIFYERCEIGVNIFDTFRGGENSLIFTNLLRAYNLVFGIKKFVVPPYQFGEDNDEGIKSGAFWFYYKLGFRPADEAIKEIAEDEAQKIKQKNGYRTPSKTLKKLTWSPLVLENGKSKNDIEPRQLSIALSRWISKKFNGNNKVAEKWCIKYLAGFFNNKELQNLTPDERYALKTWAPLVAMSLSPDKLTSTDKQELLEILKAKGSDEITFSKLLKKHRKLRQGLQKVIQE